MFDPFCVGHGFRGEELVLWFHALWFSFALYKNLCNVFSNSIEWSQSFLLDSSAWWFLICVSYQSLGVMILFPL